MGFVILIALLQLFVPALPDLRWARPPGRLGTRVFMGGTNTGIFPKK